MFGVLTLLAGCSDENSDATSADTEIPKTKEQLPQSKAGKETLLVPTLETAKPDIRVIGQGTIAAPQIDSEVLERIAPTQDTQKKNAAQTAKLPEKPDMFPRPLVMSAGTLQSKDVVIHFTGISLPERDRRCQSAKGEWPCGNFAKAALQRLIRSKTVACEGNYITPQQFEGACKVGNIAINPWLAKQGWALAAEGKLKDLVEKAKEAKKGLWRE